MARRAEAFLDLFRILETLTSQDTLRLHFFQLVNFLCVSLGSNWADSADIYMPINYHFRSGQAPGPTFASRGFEFRLQTWLGLMNPRPPFEVLRITNKHFCLLSEILLMTQWVMSAMKRTNFGLSHSRNQNWRSSCWGWHLTIKDSGHFMDVGTAFNGFS